MRRIFRKLKEEIERLDNLRENIIVKSRPVLIKSKHAIYALHKDDVIRAESLLKEAKSLLKELKKLDDPNLYVGAYNAALQEYTEAITYYHYVTENKLLNPEAIGVEAENYLLGISDLTGELARKAVLSVVDENYEEVKNIYNFVEDIHRAMLDFDFRSGELRKKSDAIKWNLKKIEDILYDLKLQGKI